MMKSRTFNIAVCGVGVIAMCGATRAASIGFNFNGWQESNQLTGTAGVVAQANWNNSPFQGGGENGSVNTITGDNGAVLPGVTVTWTGDGQNHNGNVNQDNGNGTLMRGMILGTDNHVKPITVTGLGSGAYANYDVYVYTGSDNDGRYETVSVDAQSVGVGPTSAFNGTFTQATPASGNGNYVVFSNVTDSTLTINYSSGFYDGITGFQIVSSPLPEPASLGMLGIVSAGLLKRRRKL